MMDDEFRGGDSLADFTGMERKRVAAALNLVTVRPEHSEYFGREITTTIPMLIEITDGYVLSPLSSIFKNPFNGIRMINETGSEATKTALREPLETWMRTDLYSLFQGNRYQTIERPVRLKAEGNTITDIDAAILDRTNGTLALFQLKWQDFTSGDIRTQRSKAKNFVERVYRWAAAVQGWIAKQGIAALCSALRLNPGTSATVSEVRLFAIGRSVARFQSYGYKSNRNDVARCTWTQFARCRFDIGPMQHVIPDLYERIQREAAYAVRKEPIPLEISAAGERVVFEDLWFTHNDG